MQVTTALAILMLSKLCDAIRVPVDWEHGDHGDSEVQPYQQEQPQEYSASSSSQPKQIPKEYFVYTAQKPQFAVDIAKFHGVQNPQSHYQAYAIRPYTGKQKPELGQHKIFEENREVFRPFQQYAQQNPALTETSSPGSVEYEVFHPYKAEEPALQQIYKDPVLDKIRNDIRNSQYRLQNYENEAGKPDNQEGEYLESPQQTDRKKVPQRNIPAPYEIHKPQRRPVYYKIAPNFNPREKVLNQKLRHPWNQNYAKIKPAHYRPIKGHLQRLREHHAIKFDDEHNEYPQISLPQQYSDPVDGYDIYERGKEKYSQLRNNVDESINDLVKQHRPTVYQKLELQSNGDRTESETRYNDDLEFIPIKNYAQVRKTETMKHFPREAAFADAESIDEMINAPRLREAVKSTKAQTVYTEEGYEDAAYDHAGEQKHAEENEGHGGYLKEKEISGGKYKIPSFSGAYQDARGNEYRDQTLHGEKWKNNDKDKEEQNDTDDYAEDETAHSIEADIYEDVNAGRDKRQNKLRNETENKSDINQLLESTGNMKEKLNEGSGDDSQDEENQTEESIENVNSQEENGQKEERNSYHDVIKREINFKVPEINLNTTFLNEGDIEKIAKSQQKIKTNKDELKNKYPYYFQNLKSIHKDSPLRYAENFKLIPQKTTGGTEFYDSRSNFECPEVDDTVDPVPANLQKNGHPDDEDEADKEFNKEKEKGHNEFNKIKEKPRLKGLGDKIDCFKSKYFGANPLDSPFFKEDIISNPEPVTVPNLAAYKLKSRDILTSESKLNDAFNTTERSREIIIPSTLTLLDDLKAGQLNLQESLVKSNENLRSSLRPQNIAPINPSQQVNIYSDILDNIKYIIQKPILQGHSILSNKEIKLNIGSDDQPKSQSNKTFNSYQKKDDVTQPPLLVRKKRSEPFIYEPYKIIRDGHVQESKKTTTTNNVSPLIKKLQSSQVVDRVSKSSLETEQTANQHAVTRTYKDIGRKEREKPDLKANDQKSDTSFVDVNVDQRRGEPRYEIRPANHKSQYTPVENKKAISLVDYQSKTSNPKSQTSDHNHTATETTLQHSQTQNSKFSRLISTTLKPFFDISSYLPNTNKNQKLAASNTVTKILKADENNQKGNVSMSASEDSEEDDYEEYDDEEDNDPITTTTTTTSKPLFRKRKSRVTTTTPSPTVTEEESELPRLRLITRFRTVPSTEKSKLKEKQENMRLSQHVSKHDDDSPKYREKKRKSTKSTLVTDTKSYDNGNDDADIEDKIRKDEIDSMIGIKHNMDEYTPRYEKEIEQRRKENSRDTSSLKHEDDEEYENEDDEDVEDDEDEEEDIENEDDEEEDDDETFSDVVTTTAEPTKRTLVRTTEAPIVTTEARNEKLQLNPIVMKKKIEIHKELPVNKSSPHRIEFKQDIEEEEIIKEMPKKFSQRRPQKNFEALQLFKDDKLAEEVNKLGDVEIFKENLDLNKGPRHGGNYRSAKLIELKDGNSQPLHSGNYRKAKPVELKEEATFSPRPLHNGNFKERKEDTETSQSKATRLVDLGDALPVNRMHGGNLKSLRDVQKSRNSGRMAKLEISDSVEIVSPRIMHGGNLKSSSNRDRSRFGSRSGKLLEFDEESEDDDSEPMHGGNFKSYESSRDDDRSFHGGNYRNAKLIKANDAKNEEEPDKNKAETNIRSKSAVLLNSFAQAVPILTTTPAYILDPSKRMYYYVDA